MTRKKLKIVFHGEFGAFAEEAAFEFLGNSIKTLSCKGFANVFKTVKNNKADFGVIPIENSLEGSIGQNYDLLLKSNLQIFGEVFLKINHCLICSKESKIDIIEKIYSHPQALGQCRNFLEKYNWELIAMPDTAGSVKMIKEQKLKNAAAIASKRAAEIYGMKILKEKIESNSANFTRFFIISKNKNKIINKNKTSIVFSVKHTPGALFEILKIFAEQKINLTKIESRPIIGKPWEYNFYLDFIGHQKEKQIQKILKEIKKFSNFIKILGSYPIK
ncbi:MAG: prephenate dehydratase [Patescibacteria group bacterium]